MSFIRLFDPSVPGHSTGFYVSTFVIVFNLSFRRASLIQHIEQMASDIPIAASVVPTAFGKKHCLW